MGYTIGMDKQTFKYTSLLEQLGLHQNEALVYETLLSNGQLSVQELLQFHPKIQRTNLYALLYSLRDLGLVSQTKKDGKTAFAPESPNKLYVLAQKKELDAKNSRDLLESLTPNLSQLYQLTTNKPVIRFYEGPESFPIMMADSLTSKTEIYSFVDPESVDKYLDPKINLKYIRDVEKAGVIKKIIAKNTAENRQRYQNLNYKTTQVRLIDFNLPAFGTTKQIYDGKVTYHTLKPRSIIGVIVEDSHIYSLEKALFEFAWQQAKPLA
jgi:sugar-specific transcriptional regulator TrmB